MKTRKLFLILILISAVLIITGGCATTPKIKDEREGVTEEEYKFYLDILPQVFGIRESGRYVIEDNTIIGLKLNDILYPHTITCIKVKRKYPSAQEIIYAANLRSENRYNPKDKKYSKGIKGITLYTLKQEVVDDFNRKNENRYKLKGEMFPSDKFILTSTGILGYADEEKAIDDIITAVSNKYKSQEELIKKRTPVTDPNYEKIVKEKSTELDRKLWNEYGELLTKIIKKPWDDFHKKYPNSSGIIRLSRVGFNRKQNIAICRCSIMLAPHTGIGFLVVAKKKISKWHLKCTGYEWSDFSWTNAYISL